jgi:hypothetical protein
VSDCLVEPLHPEIVNRLRSRYDTRNNLSDQLGGGRLNGYDQKHCVAAVNANRSSRRHLLGHVLQHDDAERLCPCFQVLPTRRREAVAADQVHAEPVQRARVFECDARFRHIGPDCVQTCFGNPGFRFRLLPCISGVTLVSSSILLV